ncbi:collagen alpha-1(VII) chain-like [Hylobates moloch]|uniref:collagen alpha-1(VII) chain-like n=1 Tax=Hylobates moloch TaxID=81572 RepID=UPI002675F932|nr:collagen alpha-1(VII) chain-like [Hylobates moloch]
MNEGEQGGRGPEGGIPSEGGGERRKGRKSEKCPPSPANSEAASAPSSRRGGGRCKALPAALHGGSAEQVPSPRHPRGRRRQRAPSSVSLKPPLLAPLGPPPAPRRPFQTPWARGGCSVRKRWPLLGPGRRGCERGGGEAPGTPALPHPAAPATGREGAAGGGGSFLGGVGGQTGWCSDCSRRRSKERATASRVSVPWSPPLPLLPLLPLPRHESGFLPRRVVAETSSPSPHLGSPPALASSGDALGPGAAGSTEGRWLPVIGVVFCAVQLLPCGPLALQRAGARRPGRCCSCFQLTA